MKHQNILIDQFNQLLLDHPEKVTLRTILETLGVRGSAFMLILIGLPYCQPITIPAISLFLGSIVCFIGLRIAFGNNSWLPQKILDRKINHETLQKIATISIKITEKLKFLISTRMKILVYNRLLVIMHGLTVALMGFFLLLPLPIPFTNMLPAYPILAFGLAFLEDDGLMIIIAYLFSIVAIVFFALLAWLGKEGIILLLNNYNFSA